MEDLPVVVNILKAVMLVVMLGGGIAVFRELIPMARGRGAKPAPSVADEER